MTAIPRAALIFGPAGLIPLVWGAFRQLYTALGDWAIAVFGPRFVGPYVSLSYGTVILAFMSGVLWGFATQARASVAAISYGRSVLPALWAFLFGGGGPQSAARWLVGGFVGLLGLDFVFWRHRLVPDWWMQLRVMVTAAVLVCLAIPALV